MAIKLIASDLDGTLLLPDHTLSEYTIEVLREVSASGIRFVAATGRGPLSTQPILAAADEGSVDMAVASNGAIVLDLAANAVVHHFPLDPTLATNLIDRIRIELPHAALGWETTTGFGCDDHFCDQVPFLDELELVEANGFGQVPLDVAAGLTKLLVSHPRVIRKALMDKIGAMAPDLVATSSGVDFVEVSGTGVDKASGLRHLCEQWQIEAHEVIAFGDNWNDIAMLEWAGVGVAMGHASNDVTASADHIIGGNADNAVAHFIASTFL